MCARSELVMIGGFAYGAIGADMYGDIRKLVSYAHKNGNRVHGLGFTDFNHLRRMAFDTVDSSTWSYGQRYSSYFTYSNGKITQKSKPKGMETNKDALVATNIEVWLQAARDVLRW